MLQSHHDRRRWVAKLLCQGWIRPIITPAVKANPVLAILDGLDSLDSLAILSAKEGPVCLSKTG